MDKEAIALDDDAKVESIFAKLEAEERAAEEKAAQEAEKPTAEKPSESQATGDKPAETAPEETPASVEGQGKDEPATPAIEPPATWKAELKDRWVKLPADLQRDLAQWETERNTGVNQRLEKATLAQREAEAAKKTADDRAAAVEPERQRYVQALAGLTQYMETLDPVIAEYRSTDLLKLAKENPAKAIELETAFRQRAGVIDAAVKERINVQNSMLQSHMAREEQALLTKIPEWADANLGKKSMDDLRQFAQTTYGFTPDEVRTVADHRYVLMARDAAQAPQLRAEVAALKAQIEKSAQATKQALVEKKVTQAPQRVVKPNPSTESAANVKSDRDKAIINKARGVKSLTEKAAILANLE